MKTPAGMAASCDTQVLLGTWKTSKASRLCQCYSPNCFCNGHCHQILCHHSCHQKCCKLLNAISSAQTKGPIGSIFQPFQPFSGFPKHGGRQTVTNSIVKKLFKLFPALESFELYLDRSGEPGESWEMGESN